MAKHQDKPAVFDRTPPQNIEAERSVLGAMLLNPDAVGVAIEILRETAGDVFYVEAHQHVYAALIGLFRANVPVDAVTVVDQLTKNSQLEASGGASYVAELSGAVPTSANVEHYARIVLDAAVLRKLISTCSLMVGEAYDVPGDVNDLLDRAEMGIFSISEARQLNPLYRLGDLIPDAVTRIENLISSHTGITGLATGFTRLDELLSGLQPSDMIVLAARPSIGKTALALNIAGNIAIRDGKSVLLFSLEMAKEQLTQRLLCYEGHIDTQRLRTGFLAGKEFPKLQEAADRLSRAPIYIDDTANITALEIRSKARRHKSQHGLDLVVIDYLQLMSSPGRAENRQVEISAISRAIKGLGRELNIPVIAISQLSREAERDDSGRPKLSHLRESGAIEQDADVVLMLSRPPAHEGEGPANLIRLTIAKQRNGPTGEFDLYFDRNTQRFGDLVGGEEGAARAGRGGAAAHAHADAGYGEEEYIEDEEAPF